jgi:hypothetical protein
MFYLKVDSIKSTFKINVMKYTLLIAVFTLLAFSPLSAQMDDVYYNPDEVVKTRNNPSSSNRLGSYRPESYSSDEKGYVAGENSYYDDYDFYYTSRIRRFHRPLQGFSFFDPYYVDMAYYDPFLGSVGTMLIYDDFYAQRMFSRFNRWNNFGAFNGFSRFNSWNSFGMYDPFFSPWNSPFTRFGAGMSMSSFGWIGSPMMFMPSYNFYGFIPTWGNGFGYNNVGQNNNNSTVTPVDGSNGYYGPRRGGGSVGPVPGARNTDIGTVESSPRINPSAGRNIATERGSRIPSSSNTTGADMPRYSPSVQGAGRYSSGESRMPSPGYSPRTESPSIEYSRQRPSTTIQPRTSTEIRSAERMNSTNRSISPSRSYESPSSSPSWSTPRSSSMGSGASSVPSSSSSAPSSGGGRPSSGGRVINQ